ncbi:hypothetical protein HID58_067691 [Brassica napus]|uniref:Replication protein A 70 kDa DNA-binding subunit B/D first OB fold domain-containing protein n=1 Tax=Brassica napus TaxID=3708 RepID=A0ABQ7ZJN3_BRANA|nr:hypothetical protein HID58_067691 [Brassica napus]
MAMKPNGKSSVTSDHDEKIMLFRDVTPGPHETQLRFRLIHFWEAWNPLKKTLIGLEMLLIDEHGSVIQGFISPGRIERYLPKMKPGSVYKLNNFYGSSNKTVYRVSDHAVTVSFSWNSEFSVPENSPNPFEEDRFRFHSFEDFQASCDRKGDLYGSPRLLILYGFVLVYWASIGIIKKKTGLRFGLLGFVSIGIIKKKNHAVTVYRVSDHAVTVSFSWNSELSVLEDSPTPFEEDRFRFHSFEDFQASCDRKGDLYVPPLLKKTDSDFIPLRIFKLAAIAKETSTITYCVLFLLTRLMNNGIDVVGHMKLVNGQSLIGTPVLDEVEIARVRHVLAHVQSHGGPVMKLYLWDQAARDFCKKFKSYEDTPHRVIGTLALTSMLGSNPQSAELVNAEVVTKRETLTIGEIFSYIKQGSTKEAFFECTATIDDVVHGSTWYYISCSGCHTKATKGPTSLMCSKCGKVNISGVPQYLLYTHFSILSNALNGISF